jgi:iron complex transport system ATP-binding protein
MSLDVRNLCFSYDTVKVLNDLSFTAPEGKFTVLLGRNGSGKSTLFKVLAGIMPANAGSIRVMGEETSSLKARSRARLLGYLPQFHQTVFSFTVEEVVLTGRASYVFSQPTRQDRQKAREAIDTVGMSHLCARPYTELSGGERQLVMIARVLAQEPRVILLDEPISHLDLANQQILLRLLKQITAAGVTVVAILHDPNAAFIYADQLAFLKEGKIVSPGAGKHPWEPEFIKEIYGITAAILPFRDRGFIVPIEEHALRNHHG